jgi:hypothetical protein
MPTREYYLAQAQVLFELASKMSVKADAERLIARANEYQILADAMPRDPPAADLPATATPPPTTITQPMQQQQQQKKEEDEEALNLKGRPVVSRAA